MHESRSWNRYRAKFDDIFPNVLCVILVLLCCLVIHLREENRSFDRYSPTRHNEALKNSLKEEAFSTVGRTMTQSITITSQTPTKPIFKPIHRVEDRKLITGKGNYVDDLKLPNMLYAAVLRSPYGHAKIKRIELAKVLSNPLVRAVVAADDAVSMTRPLPVRDPSLIQKFSSEEYCLAVGKVRHFGEPIVAVACETPEAANDALEDIEIDYEPLPAVVDVEEAMESDSPLVYESYGTNVVAHYTGKFGNYDDAARQCDQVIKTRVRIGGYTFPPMETAGATASYSPESQLLTVWSNSQVFGESVRMLSNSLGIPTNRIRVITDDMGGGFGIKTRPWKQLIIPCLLSMKTSRPVRYIETRSEHMAGAGEAATLLFDTELAVRRDGRILGLKIHEIADEGASISYAGAYATMCWASVNGPYDIQNIAWNADCVLTNRSPSTPIRGVGKIMMSYALERAVEKAAHALKIDPVEMRLMNFIPKDKFPYANASGRLYDSGNYSEGLRKAAELMEYGKAKQLQDDLRRQGRYVGLGVASAVHPASGWVNSIEGLRITVDSFGQVLVSASTPDTGTGHNTIMAQIISEELGISVDDITFTNIDSFRNPWTPSSGTHMSKFSGPNIEACVGASRKVRKKILEVASILMDSDELDLELRDERVWSKTSKASKSIKEVATFAYTDRKLLDKGVEMGIEATVVTPGFVPPEALRAGHVASYLTHGSSTDICLAEVDLETYKVNILRYVSVHDCGTILNRTLVDGQLHGGLMNGIEAALFSRFEYGGDGELLTQTFIDYLLATSVDLPKFLIEHVETPAPFSSLGVKGVGESGVGGPLAAVPNAVEDALQEFDISLEQIPITEDKLFKLLSSKRKK